jgi:hypothetical protein
MHQAVLDGAKNLPVGGTEGRLEVAAALEERTHIAGIGWRITTASGPGPTRSETRRFGRTLIHSELAAVERGLDDALRLGCEDLVIRVPDRRLAVLLRGGPAPRYPRAVADSQRLRPLLARFHSVRFETGVAVDPELRHAVGEALDVGLHAAAEREEHRVHVMERIVERAKEVSLTPTADGWVANGRYHVSVDPMRCECPAWTARWTGAPIAGRRAQRLPCKHIVALALREGTTVPAELADLARRAPR